MSEPTQNHTPEIRISTTETLPVSPEQGVEVAPGMVERHPEVQPVDVVPAMPNIPVNLQTSNSSPDLVIKQIEEVMSEGMSEAYQKMDPATQARFKQVGELTAVTISLMFYKTKVQVKKVVQALLVWLRIIPNVNPYFLEQEAKIKADALIALYHRTSEQA